MSIPQEILNALIVLAVAAIIGTAGLIGAVLYLVATNIRIRADLAKINVKAAEGEVTNEQENEKTLREIATREYNRLSDRVDQMATDLETATKNERETSERNITLQANVAAFEGQLKHYITLTTEQSRQLGLIEGEAKANKLAADERVKHLEESLALKDQSHTELQSQLNTELNEKRTLLEKQRNLEQTIEALNVRIEDYDKTFKEFENRILVLEKQSEADRRAKETAEIELQKAREEIRAKDQRIAELETELLKATPAPAAQGSVITDVVATPV